MKLCILALRDQDLTLVDSLHKSGFDLNQPIASIGLAKPFPLILMAPILNELEFIKKLESLGVKMDGVVADSADKSWLLSYWAIIKQSNEVLEYLITKNYNFNSTYERENILQPSAK